MSATKFDGSRAELPCDAGRFLHAIQLEWVGRDPQRLRKLAAVTLQANGWTFQSIADVLGWQAKGHCCRVVHETQAELRRHFAHRQGEFFPGQQLGDDGFENPDRD